ncbi:hypothetical protein SBA2_230009 [Acidobacteriia bacterium SbA2]|nr:hypothetical protein SBA2_230009 [Acidobacteriia bacterium SbA2]
MELPAKALLQVGWEGVGVGLGAGEEPEPQESRKREASAIAVPKAPWSAAA